MQEAVFDVQLVGYFCSPEVMGNVIKGQGL